MTQTPPRSTSALWARFRFSVVGSLLSSPPARGAQDGHPRPCREDLESSRERMRSPVLGRHHRAVVLHGASGHDDPVGVLRRAVRKDCGKVSLAPALAERLYLQYRDHPHWSYQLHYDNLAALVKAEPSLGPLRSYSTVRRYMQAHGWVRKPRLQARATPRRNPRGRETPDARDPQLRSRVRRVPVASRFPPRIAQGAHSRRPVAAPDRAGHSR